MLEKRQNKYYSIKFLKSNRLILLNYINVCFEKGGKLKPTYWSVSITNNNITISAFLIHSLVLNRQQFKKNSFQC